jgi:5-methylcytosine-specific restriction protein A
MSDFKWVTPIGAISTRAELKELYGGSVYSGGVVPSNTTPNVLVFSDPGEGRKYGYRYDGPAPDGSAYYYTGRGTVGDQTIADNRAIIEHKEHGRTLRLFEASGVVQGTQTKLQRYLGEFILDSERPYRREPAQDTTGATRTVLVFRLLPADADASVSLVREGQTAIEPSAARALLVPLEVNSHTFYETGGSQPGMASKDEAVLVDEFVASLGRSARVQRWAITLPGGAGVLLTDPFDASTRTLYEAKSSASRGDVRMAIGQLLDYRRHVPIRDLRCVVLLPERPSDDLCDLIASTGLGLAHQKDDGFTTAF